MLQRVLCQRQGFNNWLGTNPKVGKMSLGFLKLQDSDWHIIQQMVEHLNVFEEATKLLSGSKYITLSMVIPTFIELFTYIETVTEREDIQLDVKLALPHSHTVLSKYYEFSDDSSFYLAAVILDPRSKANIWSTNKSMSSITESWIRSLLKSENCSVPKTPPQENQWAPFQRIIRLQHCFPKCSSTVYYPIIATNLTSILIFPWNHFQSILYNGGNLTSPNSRFWVQLQKKSCQFQVHPWASNVFSMWVSMLSAYAEALSIKKASHR